MYDNPDIPRPLEAFLIIIASFFFVFLLIQSVMILFVSSPENIDQNSLGMKALITFGELGLILVPALYIRRKNLSYQRMFRWNSIPLHLVLWSFIIGISITILGDELDRLISLFITQPDVLQDISSAMRINSVWDFLVLVLGTVFAAAFVEESIIRGFLQISLEKHQDVTRAVIYASLAWTIIHGMLFWAIQIFLLGIILGLLAWRSDSIVPSLIAHGINNATALLLFNTNPDNLSGIYLWGDHVSPLFLIPAGFGLYFGVKKFYRFYGRKPEITPDSEA